MLRELLQERKCPGEDLFRRGIVVGEELPREELRERNCGRGIVWERDCAGEELSGEILRERSCGRGIVGRGVSVNHLSL